MGLDVVETQAAPRVSLWLHRNFMLLWGGQAVSQAGSAVTALALPLTAVLVMKASTFEVGLLTAATYGAFVFVALPASVVVDRLAKRKIMIWCDGARLMLMGSVPLAVALGVLTLGQLYGIALGVGVCTVFFDVSCQSYVPVLVDGAQLTDGFGKLSASASFAEVAGPGLGGGLVAVIGAAGAVTADALSYAVSVVSLLSIRGQEESIGGQEGRSQLITGGGRPLAMEIMGGLSFVRRHPVLRKTTACAATGNLFIAMEMTLNILFLVRVLHVRPALAGLLIGLGSLGGIIGGLVSERLTRRIGSARIIWLSLLVFGLPSLLLPLAEPGWRMLFFPIGYAAAAFSCALFCVAQISYRQAVCPAELRGRMNAASRWVIWGTLPFGGLLGGALGSTIGIRPSIWIAVIGSWAAGFLVFFSPLRSIRDFATCPADAPSSAASTAEKAAA